MALLAVPLVNCCVSEDVIRSEWSEGLVPGAESVRCNWYDGDSTTGSFSYDLPPSAVLSNVIDQLRRQIERSGGKAAQPTVTCFAVVKQTATYLVMTCPEFDYRGYGAWEVHLSGRTVTVITGPPSAVLDHLSEGGRTGDRRQPENNKMQQSRHG
jgi:hypothetical protein